jgi:hypothetical protein
MAGLQYPFAERGIQCAHSSERPVNAMPTRLRSKRRRFAGLARDLSIVVVLKLAVLMALKYAFFNHPQAQHMEMPPGDVARQLLSGSTASPGSEGNHHAQ